MLYLGDMANDYFDLSQFVVEVLSDWQNVMMAKIAVVVVTVVVVKELQLLNY